jgi:hypothetical protein
MENEDSGLIRLWNAHGTQANTPGGETMLTGAGDERFADGKPDVRERPADIPGGARSLSQIATRPQGKGVGRTKKLGGWAFSRETTPVHPCMKTLLAIFVLAGLAGSILAADPAPTATPPAKPTLKIIPGQVIVPTDKMRRIWGELISLDLKTRTGKFRQESTDQVMTFTVMPYAELLHHATNGDLQDFRVGERAIFRLHENEAGEWVWLT